MRFSWWAEQDSNLRSRMAPDLQSGVIDRSTICPRRSLVNLRIRSNSCCGLLAAPFQTKYVLDLRSAPHILFGSFCKSFLEPTVGFEPTTYCLQNSCSTTELSRHDNHNFSKIWG